MRTAEFNREQVLRAAIQAFVCKGYNKTNMQDLKKATGLHPGSLYCAFENKQGLLLAALEQYRIDSAQKFNQHFEHYDNVLDGLEAYLINTAQDCLKQDGQKMCLSQKAMGELAEQAPEVEQVIKDNMIMWEDNFVSLFEKAQKANQLKGERSPSERAKSLVMGIYGLRTYSIPHPDQAMLTQLARQLFKDICQ